MVSNWDHGFEANGNSAEEAESGVLAAQHLNGIQARI